MLNYYYRLQAPEASEPKDLRTFLDRLGQRALELGFEAAHVVDAVFRSVDQLDFARRICILPTVETPLLTEADFTDDPAVFRQERGEGRCRVFPTRGLLLVLRDADELETVFGFLRFPERISGRTDEGGSVSIERPVGEDWRFDQIIQSPSPVYREIVADFERAGFLHSVDDEYTA